MTDIHGNGYENMWIWIDVLDFESYRLIVESLMKVEIKQEWSQMQIHRYYHCLKEMITKMELAFNEKNE